MSRFRILTIAAFAAVIAATGAGSAAMASTTGGTPPPSPAGHHRHHEPKMEPIQIELQQAADLADGYSSENALVLGPGHLSLLNASDTQNGPGTVDTFAVGPDSISVLHGAGLGTPAEDLAVCQVRFTDDDQPFKIIKGTGDYWGAEGWGSYDLTAVFSFGNDHKGRCSIDGLPLWQVVALVESGGPSNGPMNQGIVAYCHRHHIEPPVLLTVDIDVQARGMASVKGHHKPPQPYVTPSGQPTGYPTPTPTVTVTQ